MSTSKPLTKGQRTVFDNCVKWIDGLKTRPKTTNFLSAELDNGRTGYCCLGVACMTLGVNKQIDMGGETDIVYVEPLGLKGDNAEFNGKSVGLILDGEQVGTIYNLTDPNDDAFGEDKTFYRQRPLILLTIDQWQTDKRVACSLKHHFREEIKAIKQKGKIAVEVA